MQTDVALSWAQICGSERFRGLWVALDNCRFDRETRLPMEGDVVDSDEDLSDLCRRMREGGRRACSVLFCSDEVFLERSRAVD